MRETKGSHSSSNADLLKAAECRGFKTFPRRHREARPNMWGPGLDTAKKLMKRVISRDFLMVLFGDRGPGKTQIATWLAYEWACAVNHSVQYHKAHELMEAIRDRYSDDRNIAGAGRRTLEEASKVQFLVIDEFSELAGTEWEDRTLTSLVDTRYDNLLGTLIITNHMRSELEENLGRSISSRIIETGGAIPCDWESYRTAKKPEQPETNDQ